MGACDCEVVGADVLTKSWRKARKNHECCECGSSIDTGERYRLVKGMWDGKWNTFRQCETCVEIWDKHHGKYHECMSFGMMWDFLGSGI